MIDGWDLKTIDDIAIVKGGKRVPKGYKLASTLTQHPYITVSDFDDGTVKTTNLKYIDEDVYELIKRYTISSDDLYLSIAGTIGKTGFVPAELDGANLTENACKLVFNDGVLKEFFYYFTQSDSFKEQTGINTRVAAQPKLALKRLKTIAFYLPSVPEQKCIVAILDEAFAGIRQAVANAEKNLANARELFESYLNNIFTQKGDGWVKKTLKDISLDFGRGKSKHRPRNHASLYGGKYPFIQTGDVRNSEHIITSYSKTYNKKGLAQSKLWPKGTICITIAANIAETGILDFDSCFPDSVIGIVVDPEITTIKYVEYLLQSFKALLQSKGKGSAQDNINMGTFENLKFPFPDLDKQNSIVVSLDLLMSSVQSLEAIYHKKLTALTELKQSILQKAFAGELTADH